MRFNEKKMMQKLNQAQDVDGFLHHRESQYLGNEISTLNPISSICNACLAVEKKLSMILHYGA